jgi:5-(carboxyamino)imidazole ribonucleotide mutase
VAVRRSGGGRGTGRSRARVAILIGSASDWEVMKEAASILEELGIAHEVRVASAHRTPERHLAFVEGAEDRGIEVIVCGAGAAAHLAGVTAARTLLPVLGVPLEGSALRGLDALLSTVQMPGGIPVGTFAIGRAGAKNAGLFAAAILARKDPTVRARLAAFRRRQTEAVPERPWSGGGGGEAGGAMRRTARRAPARAPARP